MKEIRALERIAFLVEKFNILEIDEYAEIKAKLDEVSDKESETGSVRINTITIETELGMITKVIPNDGIQVLKDSSRDVLAIYTQTTKDNVIGYSDIRIHEDVFGYMVQYDPTKNKSYVQWMLNTMTRLIKSGEIEEAIRFGSEDLVQANEYLTLFHKHKVSKMFKKLCKDNPSVKELTDPSNINQYHHLSQVFDAVEVYIERDVSELESKMNQFVKVGEALIPFKDRNFTLYIPISVGSSTIFSDFASWCTAKVGDSNFESYTTQKTSLGKKSNLFIVIDNNLFLDKDDPNYSNNIWQFHFESNQTMDYKNSHEPNIYEKIISKSEGLKAYFYDHLVSLAKADIGNIQSNQYLKSLLLFGFSDVLFKVINEEIPAIKFVKMKLPELPSLSKFTKLDSLYLKECGLREINDNVKDLKNLSIMAFPNNELKKVPECVGYLKKLLLLNFNNNKIKTFPDSIANLDKSNGGSLMRLVIANNPISDAEVERLRLLLPNTNIVTTKDVTISNK